MNTTYIGQIKELNPIPDADRLESATVVCGAGGKWIGVVEKGRWQLGEMCVAFLQDALIPQIPGLEFMDKHKRRVKMARFRGAVSECVVFDCIAKGNIGDEVSEQLGVTKYEKPIPVQLQGYAKGNFPPFIPKTDEMNFQAVPEVKVYLQNSPIYATIKYDGTSGTAYKYNGEFGVCSRNLELKEDDNIYWRMAKKYNFENVIPEGFAIQFEVYGEGIQKNPVGIKGNDVVVFNLYDIANRRYADYGTMELHCKRHGLPLPEWIGIQDKPKTDDDWRKLAEQTYPNGKPAEGIVVRSLTEARVGQLRASMKVINLLYKD